MLVIALVAGLAPGVEILGPVRSADTWNQIEESTVDGRDCLEGLAWEPTSFQVTCTKPAPGAPHDALIRFPSPIASGDEVNDRVALRWYLARDEQQRPIQAPAVVVVHESGDAMPAGKLFARGFQSKKLHALLIELPHYGQRRSSTSASRPNVLTTFRQAIADVRRARDAVAALPHVDATNVSVQGTSLGGFVAALASSLDNCYQQTFVVLAGADLHNLVMHGERDTARLRQSLLDRGYSPDDLRELLWKIEPTRIAHRLNAERTWLYSAQGDRVIPANNARALALAARLTEEHHQWLPGNHYTMLLYFPKVLDHIAAEIYRPRRLAESAE